MQKERPAKLYRYMSLRKGAEALLGELKIRFTAPSNFNDPWECQPAFQIRDPNSERAKAYVKYLAQQISLSPAKRLLFEKQLLRKYSKPHGVDQMPGVNALISTIGMLCLSSTLANLILWAHYADSHKGVCIEFDATKSYFQTAQPIYYEEEYPIIDRTLGDPDDLLLKGLLTKAKCWQEEKEWRVFKRTLPEPEHRKYSLMPASEMRDILLDQRGPGDYAVPREVITAVIIGARTNDSDIKKIKCLLKKSGLSVPIKRAVRRTTSFAVDFVEINRP